MWKKDNFFTIRANKFRKHALCRKTARLPRAATAVHRRARFFDHCIANIARPTSPNHDANRKTSSASPARLCTKRRRPQRNGTAPKSHFSLRFAPLSSRAENAILSTIRSAMLVAHSSVSTVSTRRKISRLIIFKVIKTRKETDRSIWQIYNSLRKTYLAQLE